MCYKGYPVLLLHKNTSGELTLYKEDRDRNDISLYRDDDHTKDALGREGYSNSQETRYAAYYNEQFAWSYHMDKW